jgi:hypothetical protein
VIHGCLVTSPWPLYRLSAPAGSEPRAAVTLATDPTRLARASRELASARARDPSPAQDGAGAGETAEGFTATLAGVGTFVLDPDRRTLLASPPGPDRAAWEQLIVGWRGDRSKAIVPWEAAPPEASVPLAGLGVLAPRGAALEVEIVAQHQGFLALAQHLVSASVPSRVRALGHLATLARGLPVARVTLPDDLGQLDGAAVELAARLS